MSSLEISNLLDNALLGTGVGVTVTAAPANSAPPNKSACDGAWNIFDKQFWICLDPTNTHNLNPTDPQAGNPKDTLFGLTQANPGAVVAEGALLLLAVLLIAIAVWSIVKP